jgi:hypothetical protein
MADNNNLLAGSLPDAPNPALRRLDRLAGTWNVTGASINGVVRFEWMEGGFFFIHHFDLNYSGAALKGVEYIGFDEDTGTMRSHLMATNGANFTYTWDIDGDVFLYWFGDKGSPFFCRATFNNQGNVLKGRWEWPEGEGTTGGDDFTSTRVES